MTITTISRSSVVNRQIKLRKFSNDTDRRTVSLRLESFLLITECAWFAVSRWLRRRSRTTRWCHVYKRCSQNCLRVNWGELKWRPRFVKRTTYEHYWFFFSFNLAVCSRSNVVFTCEMKLLQNYFSLRRRPSEIISFQRAESCLKLFQNYFRKLLQLTNIFQHVHCRWSNFEMTLELLQRLK